MEIGAVLPGIENISIPGLLTREEAFEEERDCELPEVLLLLLLELEELDFLEEEYDSVKSNTIGDLRLS